jgi:hypothetical protein
MSAATPLQWSDMVAPTNLGVYKRMPVPTVDLDPHAVIVTHGLENLLAQQSHVLNLSFGWVVCHTKAQSRLGLGHFRQGEVLSQVHFFFSMMSSSWALFSLLPADDPK